jgi:hypothetical protein
MHAAIPKATEATGGLKTADANWDRSEDPGEMREVGNVVDGQRNMPEILSPRG